MALFILGLTEDPPHSSMQWGERSLLRFRDRINQLRAKLSGSLAAREADVGYWLNVAPIVRHGWEFSFHLADDSKQRFDEAFVERLSTQGQHYTREVYRLAKSVLYADAALILLLASKGQIPKLFGFDISGLFFAAEAFVLWASNAFVFLALNFINIQAYEGLIRQWCAKKHPHDPDYLVASYMPTQLVLRVFKSKQSSPDGSDRLRPGRFYAFLNRLTWSGMAIITLAIPATHIAIVSFALYWIWQTQNLGWWASLAICLGASAANLYAFFLFVAPYLSPPTKMVDLRVPTKFELAGNTDPSKHRDGYAMVDQRASIKQIEGKSSPVIEELEERIRADLKGFSNEQQTEVLVRALAYARYAARFEIVHERIFGSQITMLRRLDHVGEASLSNCRELFEQEAKGRYPEQYKDASFDDWIKFLSTHELVLVKSAKIEITEIGREFLRFMSSKGYSGDKNL